MLSVGRLFLLFHRVQLVLANTFIFTSGDWYIFGRGISFHPGESSVRVPYSLRIIPRCLIIIGATCRWLIDTGKDDEGMRVLADLHGGDLEDRVAKAEFREIKDKVMAEVGLFLLCLRRAMQQYRHVTFSAALWSQSKLQGNVETL